MVLHLKNSNAICYCIKGHDILLQERQRGGHLLTCDGPGLRGGDRSSSEFPPPRVGLLGGDWSESEPHRLLRRLLGGDWSVSKASPFCGLFLGGDWSESEAPPLCGLLLCGDWSESESCLFRGLWWESGECFWLDDEAFVLLLAGEESEGGEKELRKRKKNMIKELKSNTWFKSDKECNKITSTYKTR